MLLSYQHSEVVWQRKMSKHKKVGAVNTMVTMTTVIDDIYREVMMIHSLNQRD